MAKVKSLGSISNFMNGDHKRKTKKVDRKQLKVAATSLLPLTFLPHVTTYAASPEAITAMSATSISSNTLSVIAHALDPVVQLLTAISFPIASIIMVGGCFFFMFGNNEKAWSTIQSAGLGYILIQLSPLFLKILKEIGNAV
jgi:hypothetical protein